MFFKVRVRSRTMIPQFMRIRGGVDRCMIATLLVNLWDHVLR